MGYTWILKVLLGIFLVSVSSYVAKRTSFQQKGIHSWWVYQPTVFSCFPFPIGNQQLQQNGHVQPLSWVMCKLRQTMGEEYHAYAYIHTYMAWYSYIIYHVYINIRMILQPFWAKFPEKTTPIICRELYIYNPFVRIFQVFFEVPNVPTDAVPVFFCHLQAILGHLSEIRFQSRNGILVGFGAMGRDPQKSETPAGNCFCFSDFNVIVGYLLMLCFFV